MTRSAKTKGPSRPRKPSKSKAGAKAKAASKTGAKAKTGAKTKATSKTGAKAKAASKTGAKAKATSRPGSKLSAGDAGRKAAKSEAAATEAKPVKLLSGGNPQIAKADGEEPIGAYIAALPGWKGELTKQLDALITRTLPHVNKAVKWNSPFYGIEGHGWFLGIHAYTKYLKLAFFRGTSLRPLPPGPSKSGEVRYLDLREDDELDEAELESWLKQAAAIPGWIP